MSGSKYGGQTVLDRPTVETEPRGATEGVETSMPSGGAADDGLPHTRTGTIYTSERRLYDPNSLRNDWNSLGSWMRADRRTWGRRLTSPAGALVSVLALLAVIIGLVAASGG